MLIVGSVSAQIKASAITRTDDFPNLPEPGLNTTLSPRKTSATVEVNFDHYFPACLIIRHPLASDYNKTL